jgi:hypothetical protein
MKNKKILKEFMKSVLFKIVRSLCETNTNYELTIHLFSDSCM